MDQLIIAATERSPAVDLDIAAGRGSFRGESYPEDAARFFAPVFAALDQMLATAPKLRLEFALDYFNSSSAKALMNIFQLLEKVAAAGKPVAVDWCHAPDDESMREFGEDFAEDLVHIRFTLVPVEG